MHVFEYSDNTDDGRGIDSFPPSLVIKADVAAGDWYVQFFASFRHAVDNLRELPHDVRLLGIAEVQAISRAHGNCACASHIPRCFRNGVHSAQPRIEIAPAAVAIEGHGQATLGAFDSDDAGITCAGTFDRVGLHHGIVLLPDVALAADIGA